MEFLLLGRDYKQSLDMQRLLKKDIGSFDAILLLFKGTDTRSMVFITFSLNYVFKKILPSTMIPSGMPRHIRVQ